MFVNFSPADYNTEETQSSLVYAARVKLITNSAEKQQETAEIRRLKDIIATLRAGGTVAEAEIAEATAAAGAGDDSAAAAAGAGGEETAEDELAEAARAEKAALATGDE